MPQPQPTAAYVAAYPYRIRTKKKGRRTLEEAIVRGTYRGEMPTVTTAEAPVAFRVVHPNGTEIDLRGFDGGVWAPLRAVDGPMTIDKFRALLDGQGMETPFDGPHGRCAVFDPFSSCLVWEDGSLFGGRIRRHVSKNDAGPAGRDPNVVFDNGAQAAEKAARIANRLALIDGVVHLRMPAPMWQVTLMEPPRRAAGGETYVSVRPEWRHPAIDERFSHYAVCDYRPGPLQKEGNYFAWDRKADALAAAAARGVEVREEGSITVPDRELARSLTVPGEDLAASAPSLLPEIVKEAGNRVHSMDDAAVHEWLALRRAVAQMRNRWFPDETLARDAFGAMDRMLDCFRRLQGEGQSTATAKMLAYAEAAQQRWRAFEGTPAATAEHADRVQIEHEAVRALGA